MNISISLIIFMLNVFYIFLIFNQQLQMHFLTTNTKRQIYLEQAKQWAEVMKSREYRYLGFQNINQIKFLGFRALLKQAQTRCPQDLPHLSHLFHFRLFPVLQLKQQLLEEIIQCTSSKEYQCEIEYPHILSWVCYSMISLISTIVIKFWYKNIRN